MDSMETQQLDGLWYTKQKKESEKLVLPLLPISCLHIRSIRCIASCCALFELTGKRALETGVPPSLRPKYLYIQHPPKSSPGPLMLERERASSLRLKHCL